MMTNKSKQELDKLRQFFPNNNCYECPYVFDIGETLENILQKIPEARGKAVGFTFKPQGVEPHHISENLPGWRVLVNKTYVYLKIGIPITSDLKKITKIHSQLMGHRVYYPHEKDLLSSWAQPDDPISKHNEHLATLRSLFLANFLKTLCPDIHSALELGCHTGLNLHQIKKSFNIPLAGIDYSAHALSLITAKYPNLKKELFIQGSVQEEITKLKENSYDLVFSTATLMHLHPKTKDHFWHSIAHIAHKYVLSIENETGGSGRSWGRNYQSIFESYGLKQIHVEEDPKCFGTGYVMRLFKV